MNDFTPSEHGFRFRNWFPGPFRGLCGGMCYLAEDYWHAGIPVPENEVAPAVGSALYFAILRRQADSFATGRNVTKLLEWMHTDRLEELTERELQKLSEPANLYLVYSTAAQSPNPTRNHQVFAYAQDGDALRLYDPNYPMRDDIIVRKEKSRWVESAAGISIPVHGLFLDGHYRPAKKN